MDIRDRVPALAALAIPVSCGAGWMWAAGAPAHYPLLNLGALTLAAGWILFGRAPEKPLSRYLLTVTLLALMFVPLLTGPELNSITNDGVSRWIPLGPLTLHAGMLAVPALAVLAAREPPLAPPILLAALFAALLHPDAATGFAITFAAVGLHHATGDWKIGAVAIVGFFAGLAMSITGELPPQPFVERVVVEAAMQSLWIGIALALSVAASFFLILFALPLCRAARFTLAGLLFGFAMMALMSNYPSVLVGYGAAPILGFGLALGLHGKTEP